MPPAETIEEAFRDTSALPTSLLMGWLLASSLYKRDINEERMKSKREQQELEEDVAQLEKEIQELQEENQYVVAKCKEVAEQVITQCDEEKQELQEENQYVLTKCEEVAQQVISQCDEEKQELMERLRQARNARSGTQQRWTERVRDVVQDTQPPTEDETESYAMDIVQEDNLKTVPEAVVYRQNPVYPLFNKKLTKMEMPENNCSLDTFAATLASLNTEKKIKDYVNTFLIEFSMNCQTLDYGSGVKEIMRLQKARLMQIRP